MTRRHPTQSILALNQRTLFYTLAMVCTMVLVLYVYLVTSSIVQVVIRQEIDRSITEMSAHLNELEAEYMRAQHEINESIALHEGYVTATDKIFIDRSPATLVLGNVR